MKSKQALFEALDWALFSFGGIVTAFLLPSSIVLTLFLLKPVPTGLLNILPPIPVAKLYLFLLLGSAAWHALHRIRFILFGLGLSEYRRGVTALTTLMLSLVLIATLITLFLP